MSLVTIVVRLGRVMPVFNLSNDEPSLADIHLQGQGRVTQLDQAYNTLVDIDTGAQISCILEQWARDKDLKPYTRRCPKLVTGICYLRSQAKGMLHY